MGRPHSVFMKQKVNRVEEISMRLIVMFAKGELPEAIARTIIKTQPGTIPCANWSLGNRLLTALADTDDARGIRQWESVGRRVKKGGKAFYILAPFGQRVKVKVTDSETGEEEEVERIIAHGFKAIPVFRYEDTEGEELPLKPDYKPAELPPLYDVALEFGTVNYLPAAPQWLIPGYPWTMNALIRYL